MITLKKHVYEYLHLAKGVLNFKSIYHCSLKCFVVFQVGACLILGSSSRRKKTSENKDKNDIESNSRKIVDEKK